MPRVCTPAAPSATSVSLSLCLSLAFGWTLNITSVHADWLSHQILATESLHSSLGLHVCLLLNWSTPRLVSCMPAQVEVDVFYFPILCKFVMDVFFGSFLMGCSNKRIQPSAECGGPGRLPPAPRCHNPHASTLETPLQSQSCSPSVSSPPSVCGCSCPPPHPWGNPHPGLIKI